MNFKPLTQKEQEKVREVFERYSREGQLEKKDLKDALSEVGFDVDESDADVRKNLKTDNSDSQLFFCFNFYEYASFQAIMMLMDAESTGWLSEAEFLNVVVKRPIKSRMYFNKITIFTNMAYLSIMRFFPELQRFGTLIKTLLLK